MNYRLIKNVADHLSEVWMAQLLQRFLKNLSHTKKFIPLWSLTRFALEFHVPGTCDIPGCECWVTWKAPVCQVQTRCFRPSDSDYSVQQWHLGGLLVMHECDRAQLCVLVDNNFQSLGIQLCRHIYYISDSPIHIIENTNNCILILGIRCLPLLHFRIDTVFRIINLEQLADLIYSSLSV